MSSSTIRTSIRLLRSKINQLAINRRCQRTGRDCYLGVKEGRISNPSDSRKIWRIPTDILSRSKSPISFTDSYHTRRVFTTRHATRIRQRRTTLRYPKISPPTSYSCSELNRLSALSFRAPSEWAQSTSASSLFAVRAIQRLSESFKREDRRARSGDCGGQIAWWNRWMCRTSRIHEGGDMTIRWERFRTAS